MEKGQIEKLFNSQQYSNAIKLLDPKGSSHWSDVVRLRCLRALGQKDQAVEHARSLLDKLKSDKSAYSVSESEKSEQHRFIALVFAEFGHAAQACEIMQSLCENASSDEGSATPALHREYAFALSSNDQLDDAEEQLNIAIAAEPSNANSYAQLGRIYCRTGRVLEGYNCYSRASVIEPNNSTYIQRLVYWSNYLERTTQRSNYQLSQLWSKKAFPKNQAGTNTWRTADPDKTLKVAFVSSDFCAHAVSFFIIPLLKGLQSDKSISVVAYSTTQSPDHITEKVEALCDVWRDSSKLNNKELAAQIGADQIDILVDLNGHTSGNRLAVFSKHVSPIQMSWLGYPSTSGLKSMTYRITDEVADPEGRNDGFYSEKLLRMPNGFLCFEPHENAPEIALASSTSKKGIRFGSFNNLAKISSQTLDAWAQAMHAVPDSTLYLKRQQLIHNNARDHIINEFKERGIDENRLILKTSKAKIEQHLAEYNQIDIALDTSPYNGTTTTLEALWMGVPVVSLTGNTHASRVSASILHRLNLDHLVCKNNLAFAKAVKELSDDKKALNNLRSSLRETMSKSSLMNVQQFSDAFSKVLRQQWQAWCTERNIEHGLHIPNKIPGAAK